MVSFNKAFEKFYFDFYVSTVKENLRKLGMLGFFSRARIEAYQTQAEKQGLVTQIHKANPGDPTGQWLLYFSKSSDIAKEAIKLSHSKNQEWLKKNRKLGELYEYPKCCIDFFIRISSNLAPAERREFDYLKKTLDSSLKLSFDRTIETKLPSITNRFTLNPFVFHVPCSFNCKETIRLTKNHIALAQKINSLITRQILKNLKAVVLITDDSAVSIAGYKLKKREVFFKKEDLKKALLLEEKIRQYIYRLTSNKKNFDFYISNREMNRMKEDKWKEILSKFETGGEYKISVTNCKDVKVILFE